jgi:hypothetical protein
MAAFAKSWRREYGLSAFGVTPEVDQFWTCLSALVTDRAIKAWYHPSIA